MDVEQKEDTSQNTTNDMIVTGLKGLGFGTQAVTNALVLWQSVDAQIMQTNQFVKQVKLYKSINEVADALNVDFGQKIPADKIKEITNSEWMCKKLKSFWEYTFSWNDQFGGSESYTIDDNGEMVDIEQVVGEKLEHLQKSYKELYKTCSDENIKDEATKLLQRNNTYNFIQLALTFVNIGVGFVQLYKDRNKYNSKFEQLEEIKIKYIDPVIQMFDRILQSGNFDPAKNIEDFKQRLQAEKLIEIGLNELGHLKKDCIQAQSAAKSATFGYAWTAISMGLQAFASYKSIGNLGVHVAEKALMVNRGIMIAQGAASGLSVILSIGNAYSWSAWNDLIEEIEEKTKKLKRIKENFEIMVSNKGQ